MRLRAFSCLGFAGSSSLTGYKNQRFQLHVHSSVDSFPLQEKHAEILSILNSAQLIMAKRTRENENSGALTWHKSWDDQYTYLIISPSPMHGNHLLLKENAGAAPVKAHYGKIGDQELSDVATVHMTYP